jgi:hypothetical protein
VIRPPLRGVLAHVGARISPAIRLGVKVLPAQEVVFDEFQAGIEGERLVVNIALLGIRVDDQTGHVKAQFAWADTVWVPWQPWQRRCESTKSPTEDGRAFLLMKPFLFVVSWYSW